MLKTRYAKKNGMLKTRYDSSSDCWLDVGIIINYLGSPMQLVGVEQISISAVFSYVGVGDCSSCHGLSDGGQSWSRRPVTGCGIATKWRRDTNGAHMLK